MSDVANIKLVIWDLDETFWNGVLSDGTVSEITENIAMVKSLTDRGIVCSICSKNDFDAAETELKRLGIWDFFVFPSIDWTSKGIRIKSIIDNMKLRAVNVLFVDDNINNLKEAEFTVPGIQVCLPQKLADLLKSPIFEGKDDREHTRLKQYKILEEKALSKTISYSNEEFLLRSEIKVEMIEDTAPYLKRIHEMIHRNNQLNFTKNRISQNEVSELFTSRDIRSGVVHVTDKYGDHGIIGCYAVKDECVVQFVFSCRILGMGIEQYVYAKLGFPKIEIVGEVANELVVGEEPGWINICTPANINHNNGSIETAKPTKVLLRGTCDVYGLFGYLEQNFDVYFERFADITSVCNINGVIDYSKDEITQLLADFPHFSEYSFNTEMFTENHEYVIITLIWESQMIRLQHKDNESINVYVKRYQINTKSYNNLGYDFEAVERSLQFICDNLKKNVKLLIINTPEVVIPSKGKDDDWKRRVEINKAAEYICRKNKNATIIDIRKFVTTVNDLTDGLYINHYSRLAMKLIADEIIRLITPFEASDSLANNIKILTEYTSVIGEISVIPKFKFYSKNGVLYIDVEFTDIPNGAEVTATFYNGSVKLSDTTYKIESANKSFNITLSNFGYYKAEVTITSDLGVEWSGISPFLIINEYNLNTYLDLTRNDSSSFLNIVYPIWLNQRSECNYLTKKHISEMASLVHDNTPPIQYFIDNGISEVILIIDLTFTDLLLIDSLVASNIKIKRAFTLNNGKFWLNYRNGLNGFFVEEFDASKIDRRDYIFITYATSKDKWRTKYYLNGNGFINVLFLDEALSYSVTRYLFIPRFEEFAKKAANIIYANIPVVSGLTNIMPDEAPLVYLNIGTIISLVEKDGTLPSVYDSIPTEKLKETFVNIPEIPLGYKGWRYGDISGKYLNIKDGFRVTTNQADNYIGTIYLFGNESLFGVGVEDSETIASLLQVKLNELLIPYRVVNCANFHGEGYARALTLASSINFCSKDLVVLFMRDYPYKAADSVHNAFRFEYIDKANCLTIDNSNACSNLTNRKNMFLSAFTMSPAGHSYIAEQMINFLTKSMIDNISGVVRNANN